MATCEIYPGSVGSVWYKSKSPGCSWLTGTAGPTRAWSAATRGMLTPAWANAHWTRPEQSNAVGPAAPHTYGRPRLLSAARNAAVSCAAVMASPLTAAPDEAVPANDPPGRVTTVTSGSTAAPRGRTALIRAASAATLAGGALTTIALPAGTPSDRAVESDTTASTPPIPTVPNATTGSRSGWRPDTVTFPPRDSRSRVPMV